MVFFGAAAVRAMNGMVGKNDRRAPRSKNSFRNSCPLKLRKICTLIVSILVYNKNYSWNCNVQFQNRMNCVTLNNIFSVYIY